MITETTNNIYKSYKNKKALDFHLRLLYSRRDLNPHELMFTGF